ALVALNGIHWPDASQPSHGLPPKAGARKAHPVVVAIGAATSGTRMPATSLPSLSTFDTYEGYTGPEKSGGLMLMMPLSKSGPKLKRWRTVMRPLYVTPGMFGQPSACCGTKPTPSDSGIEYAAVPSFGTSLFGGVALRVTHSSSVTNSARSTGFGSVLLRNCWQLPALFGGAPETVCSRPESK